MEVGEADVVVVVVGDVMPCGVGGVLRTMSWPSVRRADAETRGLPRRTQMSEMRYREVGWSVQSNTRSYSLTMASAFSGVRWLRWGMYLGKGFSLYILLVSQPAGCRSKRPTTELNS